MNGRKSTNSRIFAALLAVLLLIATIPGTALADEDEEVGIWSDWWNDVADRESAAEVPFAVLFTLPPMLIVTPIWWGMELYGLGGDDEEAVGDEESHDEEPSESESEDEG